jgi:hypothetical protein
MTKNNYFIIQSNDDSVWVDLPKGYKIPEWLQKSLFLSNTNVLWDKDGTLNEDVRWTAIYMSDSKQFYFTNPSGRGPISLAADIGKDIKYFIEQDYSIQF